MSCDAMQKKLEAYLDGELTLSDQRALQEHLAQCSRCQAVYGHLKLLSGAAKQADYPSAPAALRRKIKRGLRDISGEAAVGFNGWQLFGAGLGSALLASLGMWMVLSHTALAPQPFGPAEELVAAHVRSLMLSHLTDVASSDKHTVKPWFSGKLDFSPPVPDLQEQGFQLIGGRLEYLRKQPSAALVYQRRAHVVNVFIAHHDAAPQATETLVARQQGFNLLQWQKDGFSYALVSDLNRQELAELQHLLASR